MLASRIVAAAIFTLAWPLGGCNKASEPTEQDYDDVAAGVGALVASGSGGGELGSMADGAAAAKGEVPAGLTAMGSGSLQGVRAGLTYEYSLTCLDGAGATMGACDATTDSARLTVNWHGELDLPRYDATVDRSGDWTVTGLQGEFAEFQGMGAFDVRSDFMALYRPVTTSFHLAYSAQYDGIRLRTADWVAVDGTITYDVEAERLTERRATTSELTFSVQVVVTFTADGATITLDGDRNYTLDTATGQIERQ